MLYPGIIQVPINIEFPKGTHVKWAFAEGGVGDALRSINVALSNLKKWGSGWEGGGWGPMSCVDFKKWPCQSGKKTCRLCR